VGVVGKGNSLLQSTPAQPASQLHVFVAKLQTPWPVQSKSDSVGHDELSVIIGRRSEVFGGSRNIAL